MNLLDHERTKKPKVLDKGNEDEDARSSGKPQKNTLPFKPWFFSQNVPYGFEELVPK